MTNFGRLAFLLLTAAGAACHSRDVLLSQPDGGASSPGACVSAPLLGGAPLPATGRHPNGVVMADLNGDGKLDLVTANREADTVSVLLGSGDGRLLAKADYPVGKVDALPSRPNAVALGDLDGDGSPDVVVVNGSANTVSVLRGLGGGKLATAVDYPTSSLPWAVALGDLNGDGKLDVAVVGDAVLDVLLGAGDGTLATKVTYPTAVNPVGVAIADMNGDHTPDLIVTAFSRTIGIHVGNGDGTFKSKVDHAIEFPPFAGVVGDVDGANGPDVMAVNGHDMVALLRSTGAGQFAASADFFGQEPPSDYSRDPDVSPQSAALADVNGDGTLDLVEAEATVGVRVWLGAGNGVLSAGLQYDTGGSATSVAVGDLDGDGKLDLAIVNGDADTVVILPGWGDGTFKAFDAGVTRVDAADLGVAGPGVLGDVNGDGKLDAVVVDGNAAIRVLRGLGDGHFASEAAYAIAADPGAATYQGMALGDVNGDGKLDLAATNSTGNSVILALGTGTGEFASPVTYPTAEAPGRVALGDLNHDGRLDMVVASLGAESVSVFLNSGGGHFAPKVDYGVDAPYDLALGDVNGDGRLDVVTASQTAVAVLLGKGDGTLAPKATYDVGSAYALALGDLNADGKLDIVTVTSDVSSGPHVLWGDADGKFAVSAYDPGVAGSAVILADITGDGRPDIVTLGANAEGRIVIVLPNGPHGFADGGKLTYPMGSNPSSLWLAAGDLDGDGRVDLTFSSTAGAGLSETSVVGVFLNKCP